MSHETADETWVDHLVSPASLLDLLVVVGYVGVSVALLLQPGIYGTPLAVALGLPLLFFAPGYALVSLLFPGAAPDDTASQRTLGQTCQQGLGASERLALGFGVSVALLPALAIAIGLSPWPISPVTVLASVGGLAVGFAVAGAIRRLRRPADRRFSVPVRAWFGDTRRRLSEGSALDTMLTVGLAMTVLLAVAAIGYAVAVPGASQSYTSVSLLAQNETGSLVAEEYPQEIEQGASEPLVVEVTNQEGQSVEYSVVVELQRVRQAEDGGATVLQDRQLATFTPAIESGETWQTTHEVTPAMTGEELRLVYLVYRGDPPAEPTTENAYRHVHIWVTVTE